METEAFLTRIDSSIWQEKAEDTGGPGIFPVSFCVFDILVKAKICPSCFQFLQGAYQLGDIFASLCDLGSFEGQLHSPLSHLKSQLQLKRKKNPGLPWASWRQRWGFSDGATDVMRFLAKKNAPLPKGWELEQRASWWALPIAHGRYSKPEVPWTVEFAAPFRMNDRNKTCMIGSGLKLFRMDSKEILEAAGTIFKRGWFTVSHVLEVLGYPNPFSAKGEEPSELGLTFSCRSIKTMRSRWQHELDLTCCMFSPLVEECWWRKVKKV